MQSSIYLDYNATTPVDPRVLDVMLPYFSKEFGNASSSTHRYGWIASEAVQKAREQIAALIHAEPDEIIFTSGATESINLALKGIAAAYVSKGKHIVTVATEHKAVLDTCRELSKQGFEITQLSVDREGLIDLQELKSALRPDTILVAMMIANNETGTIQDIESISEIVHANNTLLFSDTTQCFGKMRVDVQEAGIDCCCISAHKLYGPKGAGALYLRRKNPRVTIKPLFHGGGHEKGLRSGTLNVPGIAGLGKAAELAGEEMWENVTRISAYRTKLEQFITEENRGFINGCIKNRLPNTSSITLVDVKAEELIMKLPQLAFSTGSACTSAENLPSHVLLAMGLSEKEARATIRISLGVNTTESEYLEAGKQIRDAADKLRSF